MKKWLSILGAIGLTTTSTTTLISCQKPNNNENGGSNKPEPPYNPQQPPKNSNWKLITDYHSEFSDSSIGQSNINNMWYVAIIQNDDKSYDIKKFKYDNDNILGNYWNNNVYINDNWYNVPSLYKWELISEPTILPIIDKNTGKITNWNG